MQGWDILSYESLKGFRVEKENNKKNIYQTI